MSDELYLKLQRAGQALMDRRDDRLRAEQVLRVATQKEQDALHALSIVLDVIQDSKDAKK